MGIKNIVKNSLGYIIRKRARNVYIKYYRDISKRNPQINISTPVEGEEKWLTKWKELDSDVTPYSYRIFSKYIGKDINIYPLETGVNYIERFLNPTEYKAAYRDKNIFDKLFGIENTLGAILRRINGVFYTSEYLPIENFNNQKMFDLLSDYDKVVVKKSVDTSSGRGVYLFKKDEKGFWKYKDKYLSIELLNEFDLRDIVFQECWQQSKELSFFNDSSVNTIRVFAYRSVYTGEIHIMSAVIKIGAKGSFIDNAHGGGKFLGINEKGTIIGKPTDCWGTQSETFNGIDFVNNTYQIPNWGGVCDFVKEQSKKIFHHHMLAFDIVLDTNNKPFICEVNVNSFSGWFFQYVSSTVFSKYTDEVIKYCKEKKSSEILIGIN